MREITTHHDGHGLAEKIILTADDVNDTNKASHLYVAKIDGKEVLRIQFQEGPRDEPGSTPGVLDSVLLAIIEDRMNGFNAGPFSDRLNAIVATNAQTARLFLKERADQRARRGVLGKNVK